MVNYRKQYSIMICAASEALDELELTPENYRAINLLKKALDEVEELSIDEMREQ